MAVAIRFLLAVSVWVVACVPVLMARESVAQAPVVVQTSVAPQAGEKLSFDVASVRQNKSGLRANGGDAPKSNVPTGPGNIYSPTGGVMSIRNYTLLSVILFAYKMTDGQLEAFRASAPEWVSDERFNIEARTDNKDVTKDQLRLMMRSLLAERFNLAVHYEPRQVSVFALEMVKPGTMGPKLRVHPADSFCPTTLPSKATETNPERPETIAGGFPTTCGAILMLPTSGARRYVLGGRDVGMGLFAGSMAGWGALGRPVVDKTGLQGSYDFLLDFTPEPPVGVPASTDGAVDADGPSFREALKQQLGMKIESQKGEVQVIMLDHIDHLIEN